MNVPSLPSMPSFSGSGWGSLIKLAILLAWWLCRLLVHYCILVPMDTRRELLALRQESVEMAEHQCPKPQPQVETWEPTLLPRLPKIQSAQWEAAPVSNDDEPGSCWMCSHRKEHHEDDFACRVPGCGCEMEQYSRPPVWRAGDPMQFRDRVVNLDGTVSYPKVMA
jgi:hypothetical protein